MFFFLNPVFQHDDLVFEELVEEPCEFHEGQLPRFVILKEIYNNHVLLLETGIDHTFILLSSHATSDELFNYLDINGTIVVSITSIIQNSAHVIKLIVVN